LEIGLPTKISEKFLQPVSDSLGTKQRSHKKCVKNATFQLQFASKVKKKSL